MVRKLYLISVVALIAALAGCGGGGGGSTPTPVTLDPAGTYSVSSLGLPSNEMLIGSTGEVFVACDAPDLGTRSVTGYFSKIGTCTSAGGMTLSGSWYYGGILYTIAGSGTINLQSGAVSLLASVVRGGTVLVNSVTVVGSLELDTPPPIPEFVPQPPDSEIIDPPPPVPNF